MHAVVRTYTGSGATELFALLEQRKADIEKVIREVPGVVAYSLIRTEEGGVTVTICQDHAGAEASNQLARDWILNNASNLRASPPAVTTGEVVLHLR
jgi:hypothetical protein